MIMISLKKLIRMVRKWQEIASLGGKRISFPRITDRDIVNAKKYCNASTAAEKGHFVVYTNDMRGFAMPLAYLCTNIFQELFKMSEEEFGLSSDGPIKLPCDAVFMNYMVLLIERGATKDLENALLNSIATTRCSSFHEGHTSKQLLVCGY